MTDFTIDADGNVDLTLRESVPHHQLDVVRAYKGHLRFIPVVGVGVLGYLNDTSQNNAVAATVRIECARAGLPTPNVEVNGPQITLLP